MEDAMFKTTISAIALAAALGTAACAPMPGSAAFNAEVQQDTETDQAYCQQKLNEAQAQLDAWPVTHCPGEGTNGESYFTTFGHCPSAEPPPTLTPKQEEFENQLLLQLLAPRPVSQFTCREVDMGSRLDGEAYPTETSCDGD
jgi:hypothetical protein